MRLWLALSAFVLVSCSQAPAESIKADKRASRISASEDVLGKTPKPRTYRYDSGQLLVFEIPFRDSDGFLETHRCLVWRDSEFKSASLSCPHEAPDFLPDIQ